jgi:DMSO/TMAO reductase YedYZ molybdopterin-dependent catalytic subunit
MTALARAWTSLSTVHAASGHSHDHVHDRVLPPGQHQEEELRVMHYGPVPKATDPLTWTLMIWGRTASGERHQFPLAEIDDLPRASVTADLHCGTKWSVVDNVWEGVRVRDLVDKYPPESGFDNVMVFGHFGYSANVMLEDLLSPRSLLVTHLNGEPLTPEHGYPVRLVVPHLYSWKGPKWFRGWEYLDEDRRGFWEERGYHRHGDPWLEERYSYQER